MCSKKKPTKSNISAGSSTSDILTLIAIIVAVVGIIIPAYFAALPWLQSNTIVSQLPTEVQSTDTPIPPTSTVTPTTIPTSIPTQLPLPKSLNITVSNEILKGVVDTTYRKTEGVFSQLDSISVKGDTPITVTVQTLDEYGLEISSDTLNYYWELCCPNNTPLTGTQRLAWHFRPPTSEPSVTLTINVSDVLGHNIKAIIPFTITER